MKRVLNLGAGTQSSVILMMMERGQLPRADVALFADTGWEPKAVYEHLEWLKTQTSIPVITVSVGNIYEDSMHSQIGWSKESAPAAGPERRRWASMPLYVLNDKRKVTGPGMTLWGLDDTEYMRDLEDPDEGQIKRQCTSEYKILLIRRWIKKHILGLETKDRWPITPSVIQTFGISYDERSRMKAPERWALFEYPLVDLRWHRERVIDLAREWFPCHEFPRSACVGCPFHDNTEWRHIRDTDPDGWAQAVALDEKIRKSGGIRGEVFLHRSCKPLAQANLSEPDTQQTRLDAGFENECIGMCGV